MRVQTTATTKMNTLSDQTDILAELDGKTAELATAGAALTEARGRIASLEATVAEVIAARDALTESLATATRDRDAARAEVTDLNSRVQAEIAKHGIRKDAANIKPESERKLTLTEQALAARSKPTN